MRKPNSFRKSERLCSDKLISLLFSEGDKSIACFPIRLVYLQVPLEEQAGVSILISAPKRHFKEAVSRNRIKRQIRDFYRLSKEPLLKVVDQKKCGLIVAFLFTDKEIWPSSDLKIKLQRLMDRLIQKIENTSFEIKEQ